MPSWPVDEVQGACCSWLLILSTVSFSCHLVYSDFMLRGKLGQMLSFAPLAFAGVCALAADAQVSIQPRQAALAVERSVPSSMRVDTSLVLIPVSVTDALNHPITSLEKGDFHVFDSNVEQEVVSLAFEDAPLAVGVVFDTSASMGGKMAKRSEEHT